VVVMKSTPRRATARPDGAPPQGAGVGAAQQPPGHGQPPGRVATSPTSTRRSGRPSNRPWAEAASACPRAAGRHVGIDVGAALRPDPRRGRRGHHHLDATPGDLITEAVALGHLAPTDPAQLAFEIEALLLAGNHVHHLDNHPRALELARAGIARRLEDLRTPAAPALAEGSRPAPTGA
jgi:hypothetical protein